VSEVVNDSDSGGGSFTELSDHDTCEVKSTCCSNSEEEEEEEEVVQLLPDRGRKRTRRAIPKHASTDFGLGWKKQIEKIQKPAFFRVSGINTNFHITEGSSLGNT
jgi:hypothetical protein